MQTNKASTGHYEGIEVTKEMIEAGLKVLEVSGRLIYDHRVSGDGLLIQDIFSAMMSACQHETTL